MSGGQALDRFENNSSTLEGAKTIGQEMCALELILEPVMMLSKGTHNCCW